MCCPVVQCVFFVAECLTLGHVARCSIKWCFDGLRAAFQHEAITVMRDPREVGSDPLDQPPGPFRNCLAHSVSHTTTTAISQMHILKIETIQNPTFLNVFPAHSGPEERLKPRRSSRHEGEKYEPNEG